MSQSDLYTGIISYANSFVAARRNAEEKLDKKKKDFNDKKTKFLKFLQDLIVTIGATDLVIDAINTFFSKGEKYDSKFKQLLIECFNSNIACNLDDIIRSSQTYDSSIPNVNPNNPYFKFKINRIDFFGQLKINPNTQTGTVLYGSYDENSLNRIIKNAIDNPSVTPVNWNGILGVRVDPLDNTVLDFFVDNKYSGKPVSALVTDIVNRLKLIPKIGSMFSVFNDIYGSFSASVQPQKIDPLSLINKAKLNTYVEKILDGGDDLIIDESFFTFTNEEMVNIEKITQNLSDNFLEILSCNNAESVITYNDIYPILDDMLSAATFNELVDVQLAGISKLEIIGSKNISRIDFPKFRIEFYFNILKELPKTLVGLLHSPQFLTLMLIYFKLANTNPNQPEPIDYKDFGDFLKKNRNILLCMTRSIFLYLMLIIVIPMIIKKLTEEINKEKIERSKEKYELYVQQYLALKGTLAAIRNSELLRQLISSI